MAQLQESFDDSADRKNDQMEQSLIDIVIDRKRYDELIATKVDE